LNAPATVEVTGRSDCELDRRLGAEVGSTFDAFDPDRDVQGVATAADADELRPDLARSLAVSWAFRR